MWMQIMLLYTKFLRKKINNSSKGSVERELTKKCLNIYRSSIFDLFIAKNL